MDDAVALTIIRPWPYCITHLDKRLENRTHQKISPPPVCRHRGELWIHAGKGWTSWPGVHLRDYGMDLADDIIATLKDPAQHPTGIVARAVAVGHIEPIPSWTGPGAAPRIVDTTLDSGAMVWWQRGYALVLAEVEPLVEPIPCRGFQGIWKLTPELAARVRAAPRSEPGIAF